METNKVGVRDVAKKAGVSLGTVSNVLNRPDQVSPKIRSKVQRTMESMNFIPSRAAGQLRSQRSKLIGAVVPDVGNLYWASVLRGIEKVCDHEGIGMIVSSIHQDRDRQRRVFNELMSQGVDGLIAAPIDVLSTDLSSFRSPLGIVSIGESPVVPHVGSNGLEGMYYAAKYLISLGHKNIGLVNGKSFVSWCSSRRKGVIKAMKECSIEPKTYLHEVTIDDLTVDEGKKAAAQLLEQERTVTALICANDMVALGALLKVKELGYRVPSDLSIVGYDDVDFASALSPGLTTVRQPSYELGVQAAHSLINGVYDEMTLTEVKLIIRSSTGPVPDM